MPSVPFSISDQLRLLALDAFGISNREILLSAAATTSLAEPCDPAELVTVPRSMMPSAWLSNGLGMRRCSHRRGGTLFQLSAPRVSSASPAVLAD